MKPVKYTVPEEHVYLGDLPEVIQIVVAAHAKVKKARSAPKP